MTVAQKLQQKTPYIKVLLENTLRRTIVQWQGDELDDKKKIHLKYLK